MKTTNDILGTLTSVDVMRASTYVYLIPFGVRFLIGLRKC